MSRDEIFTSTRLHESLDPSKVTFREAVDSAANPATTPIILASDVTGSMGVLAETVVRKSLGEIMAALYERKPVSDPQIMCMATGDSTCDQAPLQVTQFEASVAPMVDQVSKIWIEGGGGGNAGESYALAWAFAGYKTKCDALRKRKRKGYLFTIGDEAPLLTIPRDHLKRFLGMGAQADMDVGLLLKDIQRDWRVFHLIVKPVPHQPVVQEWTRLLGERALVLQDYERMASGIVAIIQLVEGGQASAPDVTKGWEARDAEIVAHIVGQLTV